MMPYTGEQCTLRVSVIIPTYNRAGYLREALDSVFRQSLAPWEIIVVDDGSVDQTYEVIRDAPGLVRYFKQAHQGVAAARNLGLKKADGDLIAWLDSDDLWEPDFLVTVVSVVARDEMLDGVYTGITMIDADGTWLGSSARVEPPEKLYDALVCDNFLATPSLVARKVCYDQTSGFDLQFRIGEDYDMWLQLSKRFCIFGVPRPLVRIRVHTANTMSDVGTACEARLKLTAKHFGELEGNGSHLPDGAKAAYGYAFRSIAFRHIESGQPTSGWSYMTWAVTLHPAILVRLDSFYELALGDQPRGYRGDPTRLNIAARGAEMLGWLDVLFASASPAVQALQGPAYGNAYLALGMLADQAGDWAAARHYMLKAVQSNLSLLRGPHVLRRVAKVVAGKRLAKLARRALGHEHRSECSPSVVPKE